MPFVVSVSVNHAGVFYDVGSRVSDELGASILEEHPSSLVRIAHDDDICLADCDHRTPPPDVKPTFRASSIPSSEVTN